jgi:hypothetical protein
MIKGKEGNLLSRLKVKVTAVIGGWGPTRAKLGTLLVTYIVIVFLRDIKNSLS